MKIAALYDIHGNLPALDAVLEEVAKEGCDVVVVGGDVVPGPMPNACIGRLRDLGQDVQFIAGNGDVDVLRCRRGEAPRRVPAAFHAGLRWCGELLDDETAAWMSTWPRTVTIDVDGVGPVLFCHATPRDENEIFTVRTPEDRLLPVFGHVGADLVVCGHTHMQFDRRIGSCRVVNAGSVGMPFGTAGAFWAVIGAEGVRLMGTGYDTAAASVAATETGYPDAHVLRLDDPPDREAMTAALEASALRGDAGP